MNFTVAHAMELTYFRKMRLIAGEKGLDRQITKIGILDYEFVTPTESNYIKGEFVMSSFLYAKEDSSQIIDAIQRLNSVGGSGLAIKNVFYDSIPQSVIDYANAHRFPLFICDIPVYFEDIISEFAMAFNFYSDYSKYEAEIDHILAGDLTAAECEKRLKNIHRILMPYFGFVYIDYSYLTEQPDEYRLLQTFSRTLDPTCCAIKYKKGFLVLFSYIENKPDFSRLAAASLKKTGYDFESCFIGVGSLTRNFGAAKNAVHEALWSARAAAMQQIHLLKWSDLGVYRLLLPQIDAPYVREFSQDIIGKIQALDTSSDNHLLETAEVFVECGGSIRRTAELLYQHENTIRYRINKIYGIFPGQNPDSLSFEELALAIQIRRVVGDSSH